MKRFFCGAVVASTLIAGPVGAANNSTNDFNVIKDLTFWSKQEPIYPQWSGFVSVSFTEPLGWLQAGVCHSTTVAVRGADTHMIAAVQAAYASGKALRLYVDDSQRVEGNYCILRAVQY